MDGYVTKPISGAQLARALASVLGRPPAAPPEEDPSPSPGPAAPVNQAATLDSSALLRRLGGNRALLAQVVQAFRTDCTKRMRELAAAAACQDWACLCREAHTLKGTLGNLCADRASAAALRLETVSRSQSSAELAGAVQGLAAEIDRLQPALAELDRLTSSQSS